MTKFFMVPVHGNYNVLLKQPAFFWIELTTGMLATDTLKLIISNYPLLKNIIVY